MKIIALLGILSVVFILVGLEGVIVTIIFCFIALILGSAVINIFIFLRENFMKIIAFLGILFMLFIWTGPAVVTLFIFLSLFALILGSFTNAFDPDRKTNTDVRQGCSTCHGMANNSGNICPSCGGGYAG